MNNLYVFKKIYWIVRDTGNPKTKFLSKAFMRQTSPPWFVGSGVQFRVKKYTFQVGICKNSCNMAETEGLLYAIQGRELDLAPNEIGDWR